MSAGSTTVPLAAPRAPIRVGVGGWTYEPWRGVFYPAKLPHRQELAHASRHLSTIEINGTFYGSQQPASFMKWFEETPDDFVFALKGPRFTTNRRVLAEAGASIERFFASGVLELRHKLGPVNWQFMPGKRFDPEDFAAFLALLPHAIGGRVIRHAVELRHPSFAVPELTALARAQGVAVVHAGDSDYPEIAEPTADFVYMRIMGTTEAEPAGYSEAALDRWAARARHWARQGREVFLYVISGHKVLNPAAAMAILARLG